jgi:tetratricopeptide (TPR) repeat protein
MAREHGNDQIDDLFRRGEWVEARKLLEEERETDPNNHWLLTQLGVTFYEQKRYEDALKLFLASLSLVDNCPLTLWNLAGTLDALGKYGGAMQIYTWLLKSKTSPSDDPCWESKEWADALKADSVYRLGVCFQNLGKKEEAEYCYRQYLNLLLVGIDSSYSMEDVARRIRGLQGARKRGSVGAELRKAVSATLQMPGIEQRKGRRNTLPKFTEEELLGRPA